MKRGLPARGRKGARAVTLSRCGGRLPAPILGIAALSVDAIDAPLLPFALARKVLRTSKEPKMTEFLTRLATTDRAVRGPMMAALAMLVAVGCAAPGPSGGDPDPGRSTGGTSGTGGGPATGLGGTGDPAGGRAGQSGAAGVTGSGGSALSGDAGAGSGGADAGSGPATSSTGGRPGTGTGGATGSSGGQGGSAGPTTAPVRDASSTQPVASVPAGYRVESNFAY